MSYTVKQVADLAGITVRTLHHYDRIGLLEPESTSEGGYRIYSDDDLERLQQILFFRELGFELKRIREILERPDFERLRALRAHRDLMQEKRARLAQLVETLDRTIEHAERNQTVSYDSMFEGFDDGAVEEKLARYRDEAIETYGQENVEASEQRVRSLSKEDWGRIEAETADINQRLAGLMDTHTPDSPEVQHEIGRWYDLLNRYFSDYSPAMFRGLGDLYVEDERFTAHYDKVRPGLAGFLRDGMRVFADRHGEA